MKVSRHAIDHEMFRHLKARMLRVALRDLIGIRSVFVLPAIRLLGLPVLVILIHLQLPFRVRREAGDRAFRRHVWKPRAVLPVFRRSLHRRLRQWYPAREKLFTEAARLGVIDEQGEMLGEVNANGMTAAEN